MHFLEVVRNNIDRLNILVSDLLDISRIESGRVKLEQGSVNLYEIAEEVVSEVLRRSHNESKPIALSLDAPKDLPPIQGDGARVRQIISNLVNNAFNYTPENGAILVNIRPEKSEVMSLICDNQKAARVLGWKPQVPLEEGLRRTVEWMKGRLSLYKPQVYTR